MCAVALKKILAPFRRAFSDAADSVERSGADETCRRSEPIEIDIATIASGADAETAERRADGEEAVAARAESPGPRVGHIEDAFLKLREKERLVLALRYYEKLTERDVASILHMTIAEVQRIQQEALSGVIRHLACASKG
jgi:DNA-directed RNA polymerase specialized sigma subunit